MKNKNKRNKIVHKLKINILTIHYDQSVFTKAVEHSQYLTQWSTKNNCKLLISPNESIHAPPRLETELSICRSFLCLGWERFPVLSQIKLQALRQTGDQFRVHPASWPWVPTPLQPWIHTSQYIPYWKPSVWHILQHIFYMHFYFYLKIHHWK